MTVGIVRTSLLAESAPPAANLADADARRRAVDPSENVVLEASALHECPVAALVCKNPYATYARMAAWLNPGPAINAGVHATAQPNARAQPRGEARIQKVRDLALRPKMRRSRTCG